MSATWGDRLAWWCSVVSRRRRFLTASVLVGAAASGLFAFQSKPTYVARAGVAILHARLLTTFEVSSSSESSENVQAALLTAPQSALQGSPQLAASYLAARRQTLVALIENESIAEAVLKRLGKDAHRDEMAPGALVSRVKGKLRMSEEDAKEFTNIIEISIAGTDAARTALIANLWANEYVDFVNRQLGQCADLPVLRQALEEARLDLESAEEALSSFLSKSRLEELTRQRAEVLSAIDVLQRARGSGMAKAGETLDAEGLVAALVHQFAAEGPLSAAITGQEARARDLMAAIEEEDASRRRHTMRRDRAQAGYATLASRLEKLPSASELSGEEVRILAKAAVPMAPVPPTPAQTVALGALAGLLVGLGLTYFHGILCERRRTPSVPLGAAVEPAPEVAAGTRQPA